MNKVTVSSVYGYCDPLRMRDIMAPPERPSLVTGAGHGHFRKFNREKPKKDFKAKRRQREKMSKASKRRNRRKNVR